MHGAVAAVGSMAARDALLIVNPRDFGAHDFVDLENDSLEDVRGVDLAFDVSRSEIARFTGRYLSRLIRQEGGTMSDSGSDCPRRLSIALWQERVILERLKHVLPQRVALRKIRELGALNSLERVISNLRIVELDRSAQASMLAREWGADEDPTLLELIEKAPTGPWAFIFSLHLTTLRMLVYDIAELDDAGWVRRGVSSTLVEFLQ